MRKLIVLAIIGALLWGGYWVLAKQGLETALDQGTADARADGWVVDYAERSLRGFPSRLDTSFTDLTIVSPSGEVTWRAPFLQVLALSYRPNHLIAVWPQEQTLRVPAGQFALSTDDMRASAVFRPDSSVALDRANIAIEGARLKQPDGGVLAAQAMRGAIRQINDDAHQHEIAIELTGLALRPEWLAAWGIAPEAPDALALLRVTADLRFAAPLDRTGVATGLPPVTDTQITAVQITWGDMVLDLGGAMTVGPDGIPRGEAVMRATGWQRFLELMPMLPDDRARLILALNAVADPDGTVEIPFTARDDQIFAAGLPIGPAPRLVRPR
ncbi:DUF2125 domain-containing protein [Actibacterium sp. XHP0104]|uniref:DUF2125 domain-containing protein n=1 Tax=Actibacterium sp. XHP0104 TaxID=2984335 RepID=UPI0021E975A8|nr:DUF2125 domain-containing protein [Actibacterium sp. XHP0104]MCV2882280.1 DUF2125 domain-containing protein [Actibacterium sp. XHP0104]